MTESSDSSEAESTETEATTEEAAEESVNTKENTSQTNIEKANLDQIVEEPENLTEEQKAELNTLMAKSNLKIEDLPNWLRTIIYAGKNIFNFLFKKGYVDRCIKNADFKGKKVIVALHGTLQTYWSSWTDFIEYYQGSDYVIIPISARNPKQITNEIREITERIGTKIDKIIAHSRGGRYALDAVVDYGLDKLVKEIILSGTPIHYPDVNLSPQKGLIRPEYAEVGKKVRLINIYGSTDQILPFFGHANYGNLPNAINVEVNMGHMDLLHNPYIFDRYIKDISNHHS